MTKERDYKDMSFSQMVDLVTSLYKEIDRVTAERNASQQALERLSGNVMIGEYSLGKIKQAVRDAIVESNTKPGSLLTKLFPKKKKQ